MLETTKFYDESFPLGEQLPRSMRLHFQEAEVNGFNAVKVMLGDKQVGDFVNDNSYMDDYYRYHDVFHLAFAAVLGWSPCMRKMLSCKRKSDLRADEIEDGARSRIIEEAISMIIFEDASRNNFYNQSAVGDSLINQIMGLVKNREVQSRTREEWRDCITQAYDVWNKLVLNKGGYVDVDLISRRISFSSSIN